MVADAALFSHTYRYPGTISVCQASSILLIDKKELLHLFSLDPDIMLNFLQCVSDRAVALSRKIEIMCLPSIASKIAYYLFSESVQNASREIVLPFSKKTWAEHLNVSRTALSRELRHLECKGILTFHKRSIYIRDTDQLEELLGSD